MEPGRVPPTSDYERLRQECLAKGTLFEDPDFPPRDSSVYFSTDPPYTLQWMRAHAIAGARGLTPQFLLDGGSRFDLNQGELGDCWVLAAAASVCGHKEVFEWLVPHDQSFDPKSYAGIFRFRFWRYGVWTEVYVDDWLPTYRGRLVFVHSDRANEFWGSLLEKAYAKLHGTYEAIRGGSNSDSLTDFTGGLVESYSMHSVPRDLPRLLSRAFERRSVVAASIYGDAVNNPVRRNGLVMGHAYSVTGYTQVVDKSGKDRFLIRIRNPWGTKTEWNGKWSDSSTEWNNLTSDERTSMGLVQKDDGEFWMSLSDFARNYDSIEICNMTPDSLREVKKRWAVSVEHGEWKRGQSAGGRPSYTGSFYRNTQFHLDIEDHDDSDQTASLAVELMQKDRRSSSSMAYDNLAIGFVVYRVPPGTEMPLSRRDLYSQDLMVGSTDEYVNARSVIRRFSFPPGNYVIVPTTWRPDEEGSYMLRVFSEAGHKTSAFGDRTDVL